MALANAGLRHSCCACTSMTTYCGVSSRVPQGVVSMPRSRAYWKGFLRLSLVTIGVHVHNAVESKSEISFRQIHKPTGRRVNYQKVAQGVGPIENADIVKGYEIDKDQY